MEIESWPPLPKEKDGVYFSYMGFRYVPEMIYFLALL